MGKLIIQNLFCSNLFYSFSLNLVVIATVYLFQSYNINNMSSTEHTVSQSFKKV